MYWYHVANDREIRPKYYLCGFPKSGLHMIEQMVQVVCTPMPGDGIRQTNEWMGTYIANGWSMQTKSAETFCALAARTRAGCYMKGHTGYNEEIAHWLDLSGIATVFIYRDLRDVAVSQAHHILATDGSHHHPGKDAYRLLEMEGGFDAVLLAVIEGLGPFPGVVKRWAEYAPWIDCGWVHSVRYEDALANPYEEAVRLIGYGMTRVFDSFEEAQERIKVDEGALNRFAEEAVKRKGNTSASVTFREGKVGGWREVFKQEHVAAFRREGGDTWLMKLGYEESMKWQE